MKIEQRKTRENKARNVEKTNQKELVKFLRRSTEMLNTTFMIPKEKSKIRAD